MSLPSGYKRLEYIQSSGTQYLDTGIRVNSTDTMRCDIVQTTTPPSSGTLEGADCYMQIGFTPTGYGGVYRQTSITAYGNKDTISVTFANKVETVYINGVQIDSEDWSGTTISNVTLGLLKLGSANNSWYTTPALSAKIYSCQIYDNGTLVRDFIPCRKPDGTIGLLDDVNSVFYANAGTGTFTAGPEIPPPAAPTGLQTVLAVALQWAASANADRYDVYLDGAKLGSTETTQYVDTTPEANQTYVYTVKAVNGVGESDGTSITVYTKSGYFEYKPLIESANFP